MLDARNNIDGAKIVMYIDGVKVEGELLNPNDAVEL